MSEKVLEGKPGVIEIKETMKGTFYTSICCIIFCIILLIVVSIAVPDIAGSGPLSGVGNILLVIFWILIVGLIVYIIFKIRGGTKIRTFTIENETITFETPNKQTFTINTSDFNTLEVSRITRKDILDEVLWIVHTHMSSQTVFYKFHFLEATKNYIVASQRDYSKKALKKIRTALEQFCRERGKTYIFKKRG